MNVRSFLCTCVCSCVVQCEIACVGVVLCCEHAVFLEARVAMLRLNFRTETLIYTLYVDVEALRRVSSFLSITHGVRLSRAVILRLSFKTDTCTECHSCHGKALRRASTIVNDTHGVRRRFELVFRFWGP